MNNFIKTHLEVLYEKNFGSKIPTIQISPNNVIKNALNFISKIN